MNKRRRRRETATLRRLFDVMPKGDKLSSFGKLPESCYNKKPTNCDGTPVLAWPMRVVLTLLSSREVKCFARIVG